MVFYDLFRCWGCKSCANSLTISFKIIIVINLRILCKFQSQVTATLLTKHWLTKKRRRCILRVYLLNNYWFLTLEQTWGSFVPPLLVHCITKRDSALHLLNIQEIRTVNVYQHNNLKVLHLWHKDLLKWIPSNFQYAGSIRGYKTDVHPNKIYVNLKCTITLANKQLSIQELIFMKKSY